MRSLIILEVEHDEEHVLDWIVATVKEDIPHINSVVPTKLVRSSVRPDLPECFRLES